MSNEQDRREALVYLKEVFGPTSVENVSPIVWECIEENAAEGFELDLLLLELRDKGK